MRQKIIDYYQKLLLLPKLSTPMAFVLLFGVLLTMFIVLQVNSIKTNTTLLKNEVIPAFEKSTQNITLLKNISEHLTFATLTAEEEMVLDIQDHKVIEKNLKYILALRGLDFGEVDRYLSEFQNYFNIATEYTIQTMKEDSLSSEDMESTQELLSKYNEVHQFFLKLNSDIKEEIGLKTALIEKTSMLLVYFTFAYVIMLTIVLFVTSDYHIIEAQRKELSKINSNIQDSIDYASLIQEAILPPSTVLDSYTKESFVFWLPKDTVGGDIYFVTELKSREEVLIMVIDGVGHGVSGAFLTILVKALETQVIGQINQGVLPPSPSAVLKYFNQAIKTILKQEKGSKSNVGLDGAVLYYNKKSRECRYAGAKTPLYIIEDNHLKVIPSDRKSVGFIRTKIDQEYTEYDIEIKKGTKLYIATDGIMDQEGKGENRYGKTRFEQLIMENYNQPFSEQLNRIEESLIKVKGDLEQSDDITVVGLEFG